MSHEVENLPLGASCHLCEVLVLNQLREVIQHLVDVGFEFWVDCLGLVVIEDVEHPHDVQILFQEAEVIVDFGV